MTLKLPEQLGDCCRLVCWCVTEQQANPPLRRPRTIANPSEYIQTTLQPGDERSAVLSLTVLPSVALTSPQQAAVAVWIYPLLQDTTQPCCYATTPLYLTVRPGG